MTTLPPGVVQKLIKRLHRALVEFGYSDLTMEEADESVRHILAGREPRQRPADMVIDLFVKGMLQEAGIVKLDRPGKAARTTQ